MGKILIVDDEAPIRRVLSRSLKCLADEIVTAEHGEEAWKILEEDGENFELIISDWMMPVMDGGQLLKKVKEDPRFRTIPFIILTAKNRDVDAVESFESGADDYVRKPYSIGELLARAKNLIKMKQMQAELRRHAERDGLTHLYNRRYFLDRLAEEMERKKRYNGDLSLLIFDIDHFKSFNDTFGHQTGDAILEGIGALLPTLIRKVDLAARYGGEEFVILLPGTNHAGALTLAGRIVRAVRLHSFFYHQVEHHITISMGVSTCQENDTVDSLIARADQALYQAKKEGRDRVCSL